MHPVFRMMNTILDFSKQKRTTFLFCLFFLAFFLRLCAVFLFTASPTTPENGSKDAEGEIVDNRAYSFNQSFRGVNADYEYGIIARAIVEGKGYSAPLVEFDNEFTPTGVVGYRPTANQTPFFPYFLSIFYSFSNGPVAFFLIRFTQAIVSALTCVIIYLISLRLIHYKAAFVSGILCSCYPLFVLFAVRIVPEAFFTFFLSLTILSLFVLRESPSFKNSIITGSLIGVALLNNNVITPFLPIIGLWLLVFLKCAFRDRVIKISLVFIMLMVVIAPWLIRNHLVFHKFPLLKSTTGFNLWLGNNPAGSGTFFSGGREDINNIVIKKFPAALKLSEVEQDAILYREAVDYIKANPGNYLKLVFKRFYYYWWFPPDKLVTENAGSYKKFMALPYLASLILCVIGIAARIRENWAECLLVVALMFIVSFVYSLFIVGHLRYRMPIEPYMLLFASQAIFLFTRRFSRMCAHPCGNRNLAKSEK